MNISNRRILEILEDFNTVHIGIIGDIMLDTFTYGSIERMSPEAPVPVVLIKSEKQMLGGAGNVAVNIRRLGGEVSLFGRVGNDTEGSKVKKLLEEVDIDSDGVIVTNSDFYPTIEKRRIIAGEEHRIRIDKEVINHLSTDEEIIFIEKLEKVIDTFDVLIICDYAKGFLTKQLALQIITLAKAFNVKVVVDTKPGHQDWFNNISLITPNALETILMTGENEISISGKKLQTITNSPVLVTQGSSGMTLFNKDDICHLPVTSTKVVDVSGAGDTVIACTAVALACNATLLESVYVSNFAAGIAVSHSGTAAVSIDELRNKFN